MATWSYYFLIGLSAAASLQATDAGSIGADIPWTTYEAEAMRTNGVVFGPGYAPHTMETESSAQRGVRLEPSGAFVEFIAQSPASALVLRFSLPDAPAGGGVSSTVVLSINGTPQRDLTLSSRNAWLYGAYPFSNDPTAGKPRNFYDELRVKELTIVAGDVIRLQKTAADEIACVIDFVDLETMPEPLPAPVDAISVLEFGADGSDQLDDTEAVRLCIAAAREQRRVVWVPAGDYIITGDILVGSDVTIRGAGMWHTTFIGDPDLYGKPDRRVRFRLTGEGIELADFAIFGALNYRNDQEANDGIVGEGCRDVSITRIWVEHTKAGAWIYNGTDVRITECRFRNLIADGVNLCVATTRSLVENCTARGTGDDCFAIWPAAFDQGYVDPHVVPGENIIRRCTGQLTFLANGAAIYGGANNRIEDCAFIDIGTGCGVLLSTTFPTADPARGIDNNFSGTTVVRNVQLLRCGGYDHSWAWRGSFQICMDRRSISGLVIRDVEIRDSFSDGLTVVAPGSQHGEGTLSDVTIDNLRISNPGLGTEGSVGMHIREDAAGGLVLRGSEVGTIRNDSASFQITSDAVETEPKSASSREGDHYGNHSLDGAATAHGACRLCQPLLRRMPRRPATRGLGLLSEIIIKQGLTPFYRAEIS